MAPPCAVWSAAAFSHFSNPCAVTKSSGCSRQATRISKEETHGKQLSGTVRRRPPDSTTRSTDDGATDLRRRPDPHPARPVIARRHRGRRPSHDDDLRERHWSALPAHRLDASVPPEVSAL